MKHTFIFLALIAFSIFAKAGDANSIYDGQLSSNAGVVNDTSAKTTPESTTNVCYTVSAPWTETHCDAEGDKSFCLGNQKSGDTQPANKDSVQ